MDSQCKYAIVARGEAGMYIRIPKNAEYEEKIWDHASGALIVAEAGGKVTDINGKDLDFGKGRTLKFNSGILCTSLNLYDQVLDVVKSVVRKYDVIL
jgi:3'(2'), 5'-bisphosphate nucleotidase